MRPAVVLFLLIVGGCAAQGDAGTPRGRNAAGERGTITARTDIDGLTCPNELRSGGHPYYTRSTGGAETAEDAVMLLADAGDEVVIEEARASRTTAYLLRADGTAHSRFDLIALRDGTWRVEGTESCGDEGLPAE